MIYEYAVEPRLVAKWALEGTGRMVGQFGMDHRWLVSDFPKDWVSEVWGALYEHFGYDDGSLDFQNTKPILDAYVQILGEHVIRRTVSIPTTERWIDAALGEHVRRPFHAIVADQGVPENRAVITLDVIDDVRDARWYLPTVEPSPKSAAQIAEVLRPLVARAREIVIVDPYFKAEERFTAPLAAILGASVRDREPELGLPRVVVMTGVDHAHSPLDPPFSSEEKLKVANNLLHWARQRLPSLLPAGIEIEFVCLTQAVGGDPLHNRFVMTDIGGAVMPYGTAARDDAAIDDIQPMQKGIYLARWRQYARRQGVGIVRAGEVIRSALTTRP